MKGIITLIIILLIGLAAWLVMRDDDVDVDANNPAAAVQAIQEDGQDDIEDDMDLGEFQDKG
jgi:hypothetical protein